MKILIRNHKNEKWQLVQTAAYANENELQKLLHEQPSLISIEEAREGAGTLVVAIRELPLDIGTIDLVGFTADGDIAIIECKLATNQEIKRKVIGQVFEYGANLWGMSYEDLDQKVFLRTTQNLADIVREAVADPAWDGEGFRSNIENALHIGNFILIIVVDEIREELSRIVRFINDAGKPAFSLAALEMRRFNHNQVEMLIPHMFGTTPKPRASSSGASKKQWDKDSFFDELLNKHPDSIQVAKKILEWAQNKNEITRVWWGKGSKHGSFVPVINCAGKDHQLFAVWSNAYIEFYFYWYKYKPPFDDDEKRLQILTRLNSIKGMNIPKDGIHKRPNVSLELFKDPESLQQLFDTYEWVVQEIKKHPETDKHGSIIETQNL